MKILVTGGDGFVGQWLIPRLATDGHDVTAAVWRRVEGANPPGARTVVPLVLEDPESVAAALAPGYDAVVHLAAVASGSDAQRDPGGAWLVNAVGTARVAEALGAQGGESGPLLLVASTAEVYGGGAGRPLVETDAVAPRSPYAASKLGAEIAALEVRRRTGLRVIVARAFPHTGRGQDRRFVVPAFAARLRAARRDATARVQVGNLEPVRDLLHVSDVVEAYVRLVADGQAGEVYNVASGQGISVGEMFRRLARIIGADVEPVADPSLVRASDIPYLVGDSTKLRARTGWAPRMSLEETLNEVARAQAD